MIECIFYIVILTFTLYGLLPKPYKSVIISYELFINKTVDKLYFESLTRRCTGIIATLIAEPFTCKTVS